MGTDRRAEFTDFAAARQQSLLRAAYLMVGEQTLAQDLVQEALTKTYVAWPRLRRTEAAEAYTRRAITTTAISWFRRKSWSHERVSETPEDLRPAGAQSQSQGQDDHADDVARRDWLWAALHRLPPRQRAAVVLRYYEDLTEAQTAEALGCAVGTVKSQVNAAFKTLRADLGESAGRADLLPHLDDQTTDRTGATR
ncbi:SigE family RNA polymerase sigma factor [Nocardioides bruguierae]|uniref:SigE family RNA polymerase sigma factor n=1 Tax=Nocardioides bruguierae TaxID=2945102 RepID=A0A9X2D5S7_9ACTN|nr:SigE family RNA polymerase sigma factor [Nocardioides bruguierae]MCM0618809.1 SigE family RNA polymerase sigma factor [Nocardioides bruguierae]